jgi:HNH endonuclease
MTNHYPKKYPIRTCEVCGKPYGLNGRKPNQYLKSRFCSYTCSGIGQRNTMEQIASQIIVEAKSQCHIWTGRRIHSGYGMVTIARREVLLHRLMWETYRGPIPENRQIDHLCGVKACCNVEHLRLCTAQENTLAPTSNNMGARNARKTCCPKCQGPYSTDPKGHRYCFPCRTARALQYQRDHRDKRRREARALKEISLNGN